ncbi:MAG: iron donor protein CyaY [Gammaproteobacteria bacterium]
MTEKMIDETEYHDLCDRLFAEIESVLDAAAADFDSNGHVIEAELADGGKMIINRQTPAREVWLATPGGGRHFRLQNGEWRDTRDDRELKTALRDLLGSSG